MFISTLSAWKRDMLHALSGRIRVQRKRKELFFLRYCHLGLPAFPQTPTLKQNSVNSKFVL